MRSAPGNSFSINLNDLVASSIAAFEWDEDQHPRDADGKFAPTEGGDNAKPAVYLTRVGDDERLDDRDEAAASEALSLAQSYDPAAHPSPTAGSFASYSHANEIAILSPALQDENGDPLDPPEHWEPGSPWALGDAATDWQATFYDAQQTQEAADFLLGHPGDAINLDDPQYAGTFAEAHELLNAMAGRGPEGVNIYDDEYGSPIHNFTETEYGGLVRGVNDETGELEDAFREAHDTGGTVSWSIASFVPGGEMGDARMAYKQHEYGEVPDTVTDPDTGEERQITADEQALEQAFRFTNNTADFFSNTPAEGRPVMVRAVGTGLALDGMYEAVMGGEFKVEHIRDATDHEMQVIGAVRSAGGDWVANGSPTDVPLIVDVRQVANVDPPPITPREALAAAGGKAKHFYLHWRDGSHPPPGALTAAGDYDEELHPRDERGRWTDKEGGGGTWQSVGRSESEARLEAILRARGVDPEVVQGLAEKLRPDDTYAEYVGPNNLSVQFTGDPNSTTETQRERTMEVASRLNDEFPREGMTIRVDDRLVDTALAAWSGGIKVNGVAVTDRSKVMIDELVGDANGVTLGGSPIITLSPDIYKPDAQAQHDDSVRIGFYPAEAEHHDPIEYTLTHEWAHAALDDQWHVTSERAYDDVVAIPRTKEIDFVSTYGFKGGPPENYAENFAAWVLSNGSPYHEQTKAYAEHEGWPKPTLRAAGEFDEEQHPRDAHGRFTSKDGGDADKADEPSTPGWTSVSNRETYDRAVRQLVHAGVPYSIAANYAVEYQQIDEYAAYAGPNNSLVLFTGQETDIPPAERERALQAVSDLQEVAPREGMIVRVADEAFSVGYEDQSLYREDLPSHTFGATMAGSNVITLNPILFDEDFLMTGDISFYDRHVPAGQGVDPVRYDMAHEWGHTMILDDAAWGLNDLWVQGPDGTDDQRHLGSRISPYAEHSGPEAYAENFAEWVLSGGDTTSAETQFYAERQQWQRPPARTASVVAFDYDEELHPRDEQGRWADKEGGEPGVAPDPKTPGWRSLGPTEAKAALRAIIREHVSSGLDAARIADYLHPANVYAEYAGPNGSHVMFVGEPQIPAEQREQILQTTSQLQERAPRENITVRVDDDTMFPISHTERAQRQSLEAVNGYAQLSGGEGLITLTPKVFSDDRRALTHQDHESHWLNPAGADHDPVVATLTHEWGHTGVTFDHANDVDTDWRNYHGRYSNPDRVSAYAENKPFEAYAENFAEWQLSDGNTQIEETKFYAQVEGWEKPTGARLASVVAFEWNEEDHPRDEAGRFTDGDGSTARFVTRVGPDDPMKGDPAVTKTAMQQVRDWRTHADGHDEAHRPYPHEMWTLVAKDHEVPENWEPGSIAALSEAETAWQFSFEDTKAITVAADAILGHAEGGAYGERDTANAYELLNAMAGNGPEGAISGYYNGTRGGELTDEERGGGLHEFGDGELVRAFDDKDGELRGAFEEAQRTGGTVAWSIAAFGQGGERAQERLAKEAMFAHPDRQKATDMTARDLVGFARHGAPAAEGIGTGTSEATGAAPMLIFADGTALDIDRNREALLGGKFTVEDVHTATPAERDRWVPYSVPEDVTVARLHQVEGITLPPEASLTAAGQRNVYLHLPGTVREAFGAGITAAGEYDEELHPRDEKGRWTDKDGEQGTLFEAASDLPHGWESLSGSDLTNRVAHAIWGAPRGPGLKGPEDPSDLERYVAETLRPNTIYAEYAGPQNSTVIFAGEPKVSADDQREAMETVSDILEQFPRENMVVRFDNDIETPMMAVGGQAPDPFDAPSTGGATIAGEAYITINPESAARGDYISSSNPGQFTPTVQALGDAGFIRSVIAHEWGHTMDSYAANKSFDLGQQFLDENPDIEDLRPDELYPDVFPSAYSLTIQPEAYAEAFQDFILTEGHPTSEYAQFVKNVEGWEWKEHRTAAAFEYNPDQPRDELGRWSPEGGASAPTNGKTTATRAATDAMIEALKPDDGGFTIDPRDGSSPHTGYAVAYRGMSSIMADKQFFADPERGRQMIRDHLRDNAAFYDSHPDAMVGGWHDAVHHEIVLDPARVIADRDTAIRLGTEQNQQAIADLGAIARGDWDNAFVDTGGTGDREAIAAAVRSLHGRNAEDAARGRAPPGQEDRRHDRRGTRRTRGRPVREDHRGSLEGFRVDLTALLREAFEFDEEKHPRHPAGSPEGGEFAPTGEGGGTSALPEGWRGVDAKTGRNETLRMLKARGVEHPEFMVDNIRPKDTYAEYLGPSGAHVMFTGEPTVNETDRTAFVHVVDGLQSEFPRENATVRVDHELFDPAIPGPGIPLGGHEDVMGSTASGSNLITIDPAAFSAREERLFERRAAEGRTVPASKTVDLPEYTVTHEWAHTMDDERRGRSESLAQDWLGTTDGEGPWVSEYAEGSFAEAYAEAFAEWTLTDGRTSDAQSQYYAQVDGWERALRADAGWDEEEHPRDKDGKFAPKDEGGDRPSGKELADLYTKTEIDPTREKNGFHDADRAAPIYKALGYDAPPKVVTHDELVAAAKESPVGILTRFVETRDEAEQFRTGPLFVGQGYYGTGTYAYVGDMAAGEFGSRAGRISMTLTPDAKVTELTRGEADDYAYQHRAQGDIAHDPGASSAAMGADAILVHAGPETYALVLNRGKVIVEEAQ